MINRLIALLVLLVAFPARAEPALWAVTGEAGTVYLFGSVHVLPPGGFALDGALEDAYREAGQVCFEVDTRKLTPEQIASATLARAVDPEGRDLFQLLGPAAPRVRASAAAAGVDLTGFAPFEPWFAGLTISVMALQQHGFDVEHGVEKIIEARVARDGKPTCGLEEFDEQLGLLDGMPADLQQELLLESLEEAGEIETVFVPLLEAWRAGDETALVRSLEEDFADYPDLAEQLIYRRNTRWADRVAGMLQGDDDVLLVVGALHLVGERGLPALLERRGFRVRRN